MAGIAFIAGIIIIIGIPPHIIMTGAPMLIMEVIASQRSFIRAIIEGSVGIIFMTMPSFVISQDMRQPIGAIMLIGIIMGIGIMLPMFMPFMPMPLMPMPFIIGMFMPIIGMEDIIGIIMFGIIPGIIPPCIEPFIMGI